MRDKLIEILRKPIFPHELVDPTEAVADYLMDNDVVPVVRCKDCDWCRPHEDGICVNPHCTKSYYGCRVRTDHFCSYGERKDNDTN